MTREEQDAVEALRNAYELAGSPRGPACGSRSCLALATQRVFWPVLDGEAFPVYCGRCAMWAKQVLETLGLRADSEALPARPSDEPARAVAVGGLQAPARRGDA